MNSQFSASKGNILGILGLVFFSGFATGMLSVQFIRPLMHSHTTEIKVDSSIQDLSEHLDLRMNQLEQIREILDDVIIEEADLLGQLQWNQEDGRNRIKKYLTPEQRQLFDEMVRSELEKE